MMQVEVPEWRLKNGTPRLVMNIYLILFFAALGIELRVFTLSHSANSFFDGFFEIGSLSAWADLEPQSS
jgi:hypothetical protein